MEDSFFGAVHFSTFVLLNHPIRSTAPSHKRVNLGKIDCYYQDREEVVAKFKELNPHVSKKLCAEFRFWEPLV